MSRMRELYTFLWATAFGLRFTYLLLLYLFLSRFCTAIDTITLSQTINDGETLISRGGRFELGFFSPGNTSNRYVAIWYNVPDKTVVWVANRESPLTDSSGVLTINTDGNLVILDGARTSLWSANVSVVPNTNTTAKLLDSGNLVLSNGSQDSSSTILWESFDHPTHAILPEMKLGMNWRNGQNWSIISWKSENDPAHGEFSYGMDPQGVPQNFLWEGLERKWRSGPWNGKRQSGVTGKTFNFITNCSYVSNENEAYIVYHLINQSLITMMVLDVTGILNRVSWLDGSRRWNEYWFAIQDQCDNYAECGPNGSCSMNRAPPCECLKGFEPKSPRDWYLRDGSDGCVRTRPLECGKGDGFLRLQRAKLPDTRNAIKVPSLSLKQCEEQCLRNCSCTGYSSANITQGGSGCFIWFGDLIDLKLYADGGQEMYVRLAGSEIGEDSSFFHKKRMLAIPIGVFVSMVLLLGSCGYYKLRWRVRREDPLKMESSEGISFDANELQNNQLAAELPLFDMSTIAAATENFSDAKKLGEGGFGPVYKGQLSNGQEIAVKRLSRNSGQGAEEFRNEVKLVFKLQHRNLVRILGYCIQGEEKLVVYEYVQNKSLDSYIFVYGTDQSMKMVLEWKNRFDIINGIARGVLYLHQDSRLRIIHRDLKASNILLDKEMNPKISDFGMARIVGGDQTQANTIRVVGTYGYMAPEYVMDGVFSVKSDVFSFGVLLLEIISGKKNRYCNDDSLNLIGHTWKLWKEGRSMEVVDPSISNSCAESEVSRCIHVGLLCVQESPKARPTMSTVVFMLGNETTMLEPKEPAFSLREALNNPDVSPTGTCSINDVTVTVLEAR